MPFYRFRGAGQFTAPTSRSGRGYTYAGRRVLIRGDKFTLTWNGPEFVDTIRQALVDAFEDISDEALSYMYSIVPVDTGRLRDSCFVEVSESGGRVRIAIGAGAPYAVYVELGTALHSAQPYIRPTYDYVIRILRTVVRNEVARRVR